MSCLGWMRSAAAASSSRSSSATAGSLAAAMLARFAFASALASAVTAAAVDVDTPIDNSAAVKGAAPSRSIAFITWVCFGVEKGEDDKDDKETMAKSQYWGTIKC